MTYVHICDVDGCDRPTQDAICGTCITQLVTDLRQLAPGGLCSELEITLTRQSKMGNGAKVKTKASETPIPYNPEASEVRWVLDNTISTWARDVAETYPHLSLTATSTAEAAEWLAGLRGLLAEHPAAAQMHDEVTSIAHRVRITIDRPSDTRIYLGMCGDVAGRYGCLGRVYAGASFADGRCDRCQALHDVASRRARMLRALSNQKITAPEISRLLRALGVEVSVEEIQTVARNGKIKSVGMDRHKRRSYRVGDVIRVFVGPELLNSQSGGGR